MLNLTPFLKRIENTPINGNTSLIENYSLFFKKTCIEDEHFIEFIEFLIENSNSLEQLFLSEIKTHARRERDSLFKELSLFKDPIERLRNLTFNIPKIQKIHHLEITKCVNQFIKGNDDYNSIYMSFSKTTPLLAETYPILKSETLKKQSPWIALARIIFENYIHKSNNDFFDITEYKLSNAIREKLVSTGNTPDRYDLVKLPSNGTWITNKRTQIRLKDNLYGHTRLDQEIMEILAHLSTKKFSGEISAQILLLTKEGLSLEEKTYGKKFSYQLKELPEVSRFHTVSDTQNSLWISVQHENPQKTSMTFESIKSNPKISDLSVITSLIHSEIEHNPKLGSHITHIDHEYIIYSYEKFSERLENPTTKGHEKIKTFKIDGAQIPLNMHYKNSPIFFSLIINSLDQKELVQEYFEKLTKSDVK